MRRHTLALAAAIAMGASVSTTRAMEDAERDDERLPDNSSHVVRPAHKQTREIERRLRQQARKEAKSRGEA